MRSTLSCDEQHDILTLIDQNGLIRDIGWRGYILMTRGEVRFMVYPAQPHITWH